MTSSLHALRRLVAPMGAALVLAGTGCADTRPVADCCDCLVASRPDGKDATSADDNCLDDDDAPGDLAAEEELCPQTMALVPYVEGKNFQKVRLASDGCRVACEDACADVDAKVAFLTPVRSAGTFTVTLDGEVVEASRVTARFDDGDDAWRIDVVATTAGGAWTAHLSAVPEGPGTYDAAPDTDVTLTSPVGDVTGSIEVTALDEAALTATFAGTADGATPDDETDDVALSGALDVDFTVYDGETSGLNGLR